jgi:DNA repair protein RecN (Recombination protein N)
MLASLVIRDFVIVEHVELELDAGFSVLTGETGAGKSILIDALSLVLGERGDPQSVRAGAKQAEVSAQFLFDPARPVSRWLADNAFEADDPGNCLVRRVVDAQGRSRAFINGRLATVAQLRELGEQLVDIHGQHAHQSLLRLQAQRELLDAFAGARELAGEVAGAYGEWKALTARCEAVQRDAAAMQREREQLGWKAQELVRLEFDLEAWQELLAEHGRLANASSLIATVSECIDTLGEDERSAMRAVSAAKAQLVRACEHDPGLRSVVELLEQGEIQLREANSELSRYRSRLDVDPRRLADVDRRIQAVHETCRKFRLTPEGLVAELESVQGRLAELERDADSARLEKELEAARVSYSNAAGRLTAERTRAAQALATEVTKAMRALALADGTFAVGLESQQEPAAHGMERVEFRVTAHAGTAPGPLAKVASGGELSRVSLAIQSVLSQVAEVPTLIFDEVDAGIGGRVAEIVGQMLARLGLRHQVLCVTHLAQVAACATHHWSIAKVERSGKPRSQAEALTGEKRIKEVARMLAGLKLTRTTMDHAAEMLREAARRR